MPRVEIRLYLNALENIHRAARDVAWETVEGVRNQVKNAQVIPKRNGELEKSIAPPEQFDEGDEAHTVIGMGGGDVPYARRLYFHPEYTFHKGGNENAQGKWFEPWLPGGDLEGFVPDTYQTRLEERLK